MILDKNKSSGMKKSIFLYGHIMEWKKVELRVLCTTHFLIASVQLCYSMLMISCMLEIIVKTSNMITSIFNVSFDMTVFDDEKLYLGSTLKQTEIKI